MGHSSVDGKNLIKHRPVGLIVADPGGGSKSSTEPP